MALIFDLCMDVITREKEKFNLDEDMYPYYGSQLSPRFFVSFNRPYHRISFMYRYATCNTSFFQECIKEFLSECPIAKDLLASWRSHSDSVICSLSCGPGLDYLAFSLAVLEFGENLNPLKSVKIISKYGAWKNTVSALSKSIKKSLKVPEQLNFQNVKVIKGDIFEIFTEEMIHPLHNCDVLFMFKTLNLVVDSDTNSKIQASALKVVRNGFSSPDEHYSRDPNPLTAWEDGLGQLTLIGKKQLYDIGKELRKRYSEFITSNPHEVTALSSEHAKCMSSALSLLASMYAPTKTWEFKEGLNWQPVPVFYSSSKEDQILIPLRQCPTLIKQSERAVLSFGIRAMPHLYKQLMKVWTENSGMTVRNCNHASSLFEILLAEKSNNLVIPGWAKKTWKDLKRMQDFSYELNFNNPAILKVIGGPLLDQMVTNAVHKTEGFLNKTKIFVYSGEAEHVAGVLGATKSFNNKAPPLGSVVLMELFKDSGNRTDDFSVRLSFMNDTASQVQMDPPMTLFFPGCGEFCPLDHVSDHAKRWKNERWNMDCKGE